MKIFSTTLFGGPVVYGTSRDERAAHRTVDQFSWISIWRRLLNLSSQIQRSPDAGAAASASGFASRFAARCFCVLASIRFEAFKSLFYSPHATNIGLSSPGKAGPNTGFAVCSRSDWGARVFSNVRGSVYGATSPRTLLID